MSSTLTPSLPVAASVSDAPPARIAISPLFRNGDQWHHALGNVDFSRIVFDPWPGSATEADVIRMNDIEDRPAELVYGTLVEKVLGDYESFLAGLIITAINVFAVPRKLGFVSGEASMKRMATGNVRMPDICFTSLARLPGGKMSRESVSPIAPDLAVEVLSASNTALEIDLKLAELFASGTRLAWVIDPRAETAEVYRKPGSPDLTLHDGESLDGEDVLPGFTLSLHELFHTYD